MRNQIIKTIKKTAICEKLTFSGGGYGLQNPEEVADAIIKVIFGDLADNMSENLKPQGKLKNLLKAVKKDKKMVKVKPLSSSELLNKL